MPQAGDQAINIGLLMGTQDPTVTVGNGVEVWQGGTADPTVLFPGASQPSFRRDPDRKAVS